MDYKDYKEKLLIKRIVFKLAGVGKLENPGFRHSLIDFFRNWILNKISIIFIKKIVVRPKRYKKRQGLTLIYRK